MVTASDPVPRNVDLSDHLRGLTPAVAASAGRHRVRHIVCNSTVLATDKSLPGNHVPVPRLVDPNAAVRDRARALTAASPPESTVLRGAWNCGGSRVSPVACALL